METDTKQHFYDVSNLLRTCSIVFCAKTSSEHVALVKKVARKYLPRFWITGKLQFHWTYSIARQRLTLLLKNVTPFFYILQARSPHCGAARMRPKRPCHPHNKPAKIFTGALYQLSTVRK